MTNSTKSKNWQKLRTFRPVLITF